MSMVFQDIGADVGPLRHIYIGVDGSFNVQHVGANDNQFNPSNGDVGDAGTFVVYGYLYSPFFARHSGGTSVPDCGAQIWDMNSQTAVATVNGVSRVVTILQTLGDDLTLFIVDTYVHGQNCWRTDYVLQNNYTSEISCILYRAGDVYLNGSNDGYGALRPGGGVGVAETAGNSPPGNVLWFIPLVAGDYQEGRIESLWETLAGQSSLSNTIETDLCDAGMGVAWQMTLPAKSLVVRSCLTQVVLAAPVIPPPVDAWHFRGFCYRGPYGNTQAPLGGVTLKLLAGASNPPTVVRRQTTSDAGGFWNFYEDQDYTNYMVEAVDPDGMAATGSATGDGTIVSFTKIKWLSPARGVHDGNQFFKE